MALQLFFFFFRAGRQSQARDKVPRLVLFRLGLCNKHIHSIPPSLLVPRDICRCLHPQTGKLVTLKPPTPRPGARSMLSYFPNLLRDFRSITVLRNTAALNQISHQYKEHVLKECKKKQAIAVSGWVMISWVGHRMVSGGVIGAANLMSCWGCPREDDPLLNSGAQGVECITALLRRDSRPEQEGDSSW